MGRRARGTAEQACGRAHVLARESASSRSEQVGGGVGADSAGGRIGRGQGDTVQIRLLEVVAADLVLRGAELRLRAQPGGELFVERCAHCLRHPGVGRIADGRVVESPIHVLGRAP